MLSELLIAAAVAAIASLLACRAMIAAGLFDMPGATRKPHKDPTPSSGGVGVALGFALGMLLLAQLNWWRAEIAAEAALRMARAAALICAFAGLGFVDDLRQLGPRAKLLLFALFSFAAAWVGGVVTSLPLNDQLVINLPFTIGLVCSALWVFTLVNTVNFMDGANGLAMGSVVLALLALTAVAIDANALTSAALALCGAGALGGLLAWNYPNGRLFAGDSGALSAGALAAIASLLAIREGGVSPYVPPILFFPLLADVLLTLAWRVSRGRALLNGHAEHHYQIAARAGLRSVVAPLYWLAMAVCGAAGYAVHDAGPAAAAPVLVGLAVTALVASALTRRFAETRGMGEV